MAENEMFCPRCGKPGEARPWTGFDNNGTKYESLTCHACGFTFSIYAYRLRTVLDAQGKQVAVFADNEGL